MTFTGHAIECRINAEDPDTFAPVARDDSRLQRARRPGRARRHVRALGVHDSAVLRLDDRQDHRARPRPPGSHRAHAPHARDDGHRGHQDLDSAPPARSSPTRISSPAGSAPRSWSATSSKRRSSACERSRQAGSGSRPGGRGFLEPILSRSLDAPSLSHHRHRAVRRARDSTRSRSPTRVSLAARGCCSCAREGRVERGARSRWPSARRCRAPRRRAGDRQRPRRHRAAGGRRRRARRAGRSGGRRRARDRRARRDRRALDARPRRRSTRPWRATPSYIAVGPVFGTATKDTGYTPRGLDLVRYAAHRGKPVVAIGGITLERARGGGRGGGVAQSR